MKINLLLAICLILLFQCRSQVVCGNRVCPRGFSCTPAKTCVSTPIINNAFSSLNFARFIDDCSINPCRYGFVCLNKKCIDVKTLKGPTQRPSTKPFRRGFLDRDACIYSMFYCDQNIYHICKNFPSFAVPGSKGYAVIMSNPLGLIKLRMQRSGSRFDDYAVHWNYHVIFIWKNGRNSKVFDFDSLLPWGAKFPDYYSRSMKTYLGQPPTFFRVVPCEKYQEYYASTRGGHLGNVTIGGRRVYRYEYPPPTPEFIVNRHGMNNTLPLFVNMAVQSRELGEVMTASRLVSFFMS